jgi:hypothetical protein
VRGIVLSLALLAVPAVAHAQAPDAPPAPWQGIWRGTIGDQAVRVCLMSGAYSFGGYYYDRHLRVIRLERPDTGDLWIEEDNRDPNRPRWTVTMDGAELAGRWSQGARTLPIRLTRIAGPAMGEESCGSLTFNRPRLTPTRIVSRRATRDGVGYTRLTAEVGPAFAATIESFALDGDSPATRRINQVLRQPLPIAPATSEWFDCMQGNLNTHGSDGSYERTIAPTMITARWLAVRDHSDTYCGGNHPNIANRPRVFDRASGAEINLHDWLAARAVNRTRYDGSDEEYVMLTEPFRRWLVGPLRRGADDDATTCHEAIVGTEYWTIGLARTGLVFSPDLAHVIRACGEDFPVTFARLAPWLNAQGRAGAASLQPAARPARRGGR